MSNSESLNLTLDFLVREIDMNFKDLTTPKKGSQIERAYIAVFRQVNKWISGEDDHSTGDLSSFLLTSDTFLARYIVNDNINNDQK